MNDFSELERELKKLRLARPSAELLVRIERAFASNEDADPHLNPLPQGEADAERPVRATRSASTEARNIVHPARFKMGWLSLGIGLAAAAVFLIFARVGVDRSSKPNRVAQNTPPPATSTVATAQFIPAGSTQVVYNTRDEGLHFPAGSDEPVRRVRSQKLETLQWRNPKTGASLRVSYPTEEVVLIPVSGQ